MFLFEFSEKQYLDWSGTLELNLHKFDIQFDGDGDVHTGFFCV